MTAAIWCGVFNLLYALRSFTGLLLVTLIVKVYESLFVLLMSRFYVVSPFKILVWACFASLPQTSDHQTVPEMVPQTDSKSSSERLLALPTLSVHDEAEAEVIRKGGMAAAIARSFVVSMSLSRNDFGQVVHTHMRLCRRAVQCGTGRRRQ